MSRFCYMNVPKNGTSGLARAYRETGHVPSRCPVPFVLSRVPFPEAANTEEAHCVPSQADLFAAMDDMAEWAQSHPEVNRLARARAFGGEA